MQAYAEGFNILHEANAGSKYVKGDAEVAPMDCPEDYQYDVDVSEVVSYGVAVALLAAGYLILLMFLGAIETATSMGS